MPPVKVLQPPPVFMIDSDSVGLEVVDPDRLLKPGDIFKGRTVVGVSTEADNGKLTQKLTLADEGSINFATGEITAGMGTPLSNVDAASLSKMTDKEFEAAVAPVLESGSPFTPARPFFGERNNVTVDYTREALDRVRDETRESILQKGMNIAAKAIGGLSPFRITADTFTPIEKSEDVSDSVAVPYGNEVVYVAGQGRQPSEEEELQALRERVRSLEGRVEPRAVAEIVDTTPSRKITVKK
jgi:hypothetical protein